MKIFFKFTILFGGISIFFLSCKKDPKEVDSMFELLQEYQGGVIVYVDKTAKHGIIASLTDQNGNMGADWNNGNVDAISTSISIGAGSENTNNIVNKIGGGDYAAKLCFDLDLNGFNDWFLPSRDELDVLYKYRDTLNMSSRYWSSSGFGQYLAYSQSFSSGMFGGLIESSWKYILYNVRCVRNF